MLKRNLKTIKERKASVRTELLKEYLHEHFED